MHLKVTNGDPFSACFSSVLRRRFVAAPLSLAEAAPCDGTRALVAISTGGLAIADWSLGVQI